MRFPRVRFTLGNLLFAVAVVAVNCAVLRRLFDEDKSVYGIPAPAVLALAGSLPLVNFAVIGALVYGARQVRNLRGGRPTDRRPAMAAGTFFSLHFLALGTVFTIFTPDAIDSYLRSYAPLVNTPESGCVRYHGLHEDVFGFLAVWSPVLGIFISGPIFFLSWIGSILASRCAATLPRRRLWVVTGLVTLGFAATALAIAITPRPFTDQQDIELGFQIIDENSNPPIRTAFPRIRDAFDGDSPCPTALTDGDGCARLTGRFEVVGQRGGFQTIGRFSPWGRWLEIYAAGYQTTCIALPDVMGASVSLDRIRLANIVLEKGQRRGDSLREIAGTYLIAGLGGWMVCPFQISPDGRFTASFPANKCTRNEYGYMKRVGEQLELVPIPHPGREIQFWIKPPYRTIEWDGSLFLTTADDQVLREFCRLSLWANRSTERFVPSGVYVREQDCQKVPTGLPRLPPDVWMKFLLGEIGLRNQ